MANPWDQAWAVDDDDEKDKPWARTWEVEAPKERTWGEAAADTGVQLAEGVNSLLGAVPSLIAPNSAAAEFFRDNSEYWRDKQSDAIKQRGNAASVAIDAAGEDGVIAQISEAAKQYFTDPALAARFVTTNLPSMIPGIGAAKLAQAASLARGATAIQAASAATTAAGATNAALNAGGARGEAYEDIKRTLIKQGLSPEEAEQQALSDSRVAAAVGGLAGFVSGKTGLEKAIVGRAGTAGAGRAFAGGLLKEAAGEQLEEVAPKLTTNLLASQYDDRDITQDVGRTMVETAIGAGPGSILSGGMDAFSRQRTPDQLPPPPPPPPPNAQADLDTAAADLQSAVDPYLGIRQATTVDEAIEAAGVAAAAPVPSPTLDQRIAQAESRGLVGRQLDVQQQLDAASGLPAAARVPGVTPAEAIAQAQGAALPLGLPEQDIVSKFEAKRAAAIAAIDEALGLAGTPRGESTPAELEAKRKRATQVALGEMGDTLPRFRYTPELQGNKEAEPAGAAEPDLVGAYVQQMRETNTPAARAFVQMFEAGFVKPADVQGMLDKQSVKGRVTPAPAIPSNATPLQTEGLQIEQKRRRAAPTLDLKDPAGAVAERARQASGEPDISAGEAQQRLEAAAAARQEPVAPTQAKQYIDALRLEETPQARALVGEYEAGRVGDQDIADAVNMQRRYLMGGVEASQDRINTAAGQVSAPAGGLQIESAGGRPSNPALTEAVALYGDRPLTSQDLTVEGATARIERAGQRAPQAEAGGIEIATGEDLAPRGAFLGRNEAIRVGNNLPRPVRVGGVLAASLTDEQLQTTAANNALPAITRRGAQIEIMARQQELRGEQAATPTADASARLEAAAALAPPAAGGVSAQLEAAASQGRALAQPTAGRIVTSTAKLSTPRAQVPGSQHTLQDQGVDHNYTVVEPARLGGQGKMLAQVSRIFGKKLVVFESDTLQADGFVRDDDNGTVYVNAKSTVSPLAVFGHELTHLIKRDNADAYTALEAVVKKNLAPEGMAQFEQEYGAGANLEELTSDLTGNRFQEPQFWSDVFNEIAAANPEKSRSIITRLAGAMNKAVNAFLKAVRQPGFNADQYVKDLDGVKAAVKQAMVQYAQQQREPAMRMEAELMRAEGQVNLAAGSSAPANDSQADIAASPTRNAQVDEPERGEEEGQRISKSVPRAGGVVASAENENRVAVVVGAKPGEFDWDFTRSDLKPPPFAAPTQRGPRLEKVGEAVYEVLRSSGFKKLAEDAFGIKNLRVVPLHGSWLNKPEPSFAIYGDGLTFEQADDLSKMLGFAFAQDATVVYQPTTEETPGDRPAVYLGNDKRLSPQQLQAVLSSAQAEGLDYSTTADGKAVKFLHFGSEQELEVLLQKTSRIAKSAGLTSTGVFNVRSQLNESKDYTQRPGRSAGKAVWFSDASAGSSGLFGRTVNNVLVPYAKAVGAEGYRFAVSRFGERFGLSGDQQELIRSALIPKNGSAKATVDIASGKVKLEVTGTGRNGKPSVTDILWALQNRSAQAGLIEPGDYSDQARKVIAEALADEVIHHIETAPAGKSAIGWYDRALKAAKKQYLSIFPEIGTNPDAEMEFDALLGIASQGNDVFSNSIFAARMYELRRGGQKMSLSQAVAALKGSFGGETVAIENNYLKLEELLDRNGYADMRKFFNKKDTVANINARLRSDTTLYFKGKPLQVEGAADQTVTGWMVFGPKIGSFINNLHGDYSTLTADLWFSRTWNRILGFSFVHVPALEAEQFQRFQQAIIAEYGFSRDREGPIAPKRVDKNGKVSMPEFGIDMAAVSEARVQDVLADPDEALKFAAELEGAYRKGGYKQKSDLRRAAKNWVENRRDAEAAPRTDLERSFQQDTVETTQKIIRRRTGATITIADIQAALWYYEKEDLFKKLGGTNKKSEAADYAAAAEETIKAHNEGELFYAKTDDRYVYGAKGDYLPGNRITPSRTRERKAADIPVAELRGRKVAMQVRIEDTGETGTLTMDAADSLTDIDERESAMQRLLECLRK